MNYLHIVSFVFIQFFILSTNCITDDRELVVSSGGIGVEGYVYSKSYSTPLNNVAVQLTSFEGTNLQRTISDVTAYSDSTGWFGCFAGMGYSIRGNDTFNLVHRCRAIFSKDNFTDTIIEVYDTDDFLGLTLFLHR